MEGEPGKSLMDNVSKADRAESLGETEVLKGQSTGGERNIGMGIMHGDARSSSTLIVIKCCMICSDVQFFTVIHQSLGFLCGKLCGMFYIHIFFISVLLKSKHNHHYPGRNHSSMHIQPLCAEDGSAPLVLPDEEGLDGPSGICDEGPENDC